MKENAVVPEGSLVVGTPGRVVRQVTDEERERLRWTARHYVSRARTYLPAGGEGP